MKKYVNVGLDYIKDLKFSGARNGKQLEKKLIEMLGEDTGNEAIYRIYENYDRCHNNKDKINFYNFKNQNLKTSLTISSLFGSDIYIENHVIGFMKIEIILLTVFLMSVVIME